MIDFFRGLQYFIEGFNLITRAEFRRFIIFPLLINIVLFTCLLVLAAFWFEDIVQWIKQFLPTWLHWLEWLIWFIAFLMLLMIWVYISTIFVNMLSGPFNSVLAQKITTHFLGEKLTDQSLLLQLPLAVKREGQLIFYYLPRAILYLLFFLIPLIQVLAPVVWFSFNAWVMAMQYLDYPMDNHQIGVNQMKELMRRKRLLNIGFGTGAMIATMIPFLNFIVIPTAVAGASLLWAKEYWPLLHK